MQTGKNKKTLILGFGNPDRGDDGVAWHILKKIAELSGHDWESEGFESGIVKLNNHLNLWFNLQLIPEVAEDLANYQKAIFLDAHTSEIKDEISIVKVEPDYQRSPFTHHLTAATCLALAKSLYGRTPQATLISIRGTDFSFTHALSKQTARLANQVVKLIMSWQ